MIFKTTLGTIVCCDDSYCKKFDNNQLCCKGGTWYYRGYLLHREDGPAIERSGGMARWYLNGNYYTEEKHQKIMNLKSKNRVLDDI